MKITRREFLKILAASAAALALPVPAFSSRRLPYVNKGEVVNYVGYHPGGFTGGQIVLEIGKWDGIGYPVILMTNTFPPGKEIFHDFDLADLNREIPDRFWHNPENWKLYPNVHTWLRVQRFGETIEESVKHLNLALAGTKWSIQP